MHFDRWRAELSLVITVSGLDTMSLRSMTLVGKLREMTNEYLLIIIFDLHAFLEPRLTIGFFDYLYAKI